MGERERTERIALVALLRARPDGLSWGEITAEILESGSAVAVWQRHAPPTLITLPGTIDPLVAASREIVAWSDKGLEVLSILDSNYPSRLRGVHQAPPLLFARGQLDPSDVGVSVVGSRRASKRGLDLAAGIADGLTANGFTVVAGLAAGIDTAAHVAALRAGGRTVAVIGTGLDRTYPAENGRLQDHISTEGLVLSQFWPDAPPRKMNFLLRNATMSGYGLATIVVEAGEHSGSRAQARMAVEHGRPVILTDLVARNNGWARDLLDRPHVHVASDASEAIDLIHGIRDQDQAADAFIREIVGGGL